jgi:hypothetical protein
MKASLLIRGGLALLLLPSRSEAAVTNYSAVLDAKQETPPTGSPATGTAVLQYDDATKALTGTVIASFGGADTVTAAYVQGPGGCGVAGGMIGSIGTPSGAVFTVNLTLTDAQAGALVAGNTYVNIQTIAFADGEIRGQIYPNASTATCPSGDGGPPDAGGSSGSSGTSGTSGGSSGKTSSSGGSNGATTAPSDDAGTPATGGSSSSGGCSTTGASETGTLLGIAAIATIAAAVATRGRKKR